MSIEESITWSDLENCPGVHRFPLRPIRYRLASSLCLIAFRVCSSDERVLPTATLRTTLPFSPVRPACLRCFHRDQIKTAFIRAGGISYADAQVESSLKVMAGIELFQRYRVGWIREGAPTISNLLHHPQGRPQPEINLFPIELGVRVRSVPRQDIRGEFD